MKASRVVSILSEIRHANPKARLVAATKYATAQQVNGLLSDGVGAVGENRLQDALEKFPRLSPCEKHFFGTIQSNKIGKLVRHFDVIDTLCDKAHAEKLNTAAKQAGKKQRVMVQVNAGQERRKHGLPLDETTVFDFLVFLKGQNALAAEGLFFVVPEKQGAIFFAKAKSLFDALAPAFSLKELSMGTSGDYPDALENGATQVRVGRLLFEPEKTK